jgi:putative transcriptional regulator
MMPTSTSTIHSTVYDEMKRDTWMTHPASLDLVFHPQPEQLWQMILREKGGKYRLLAEGPEDLSWN